MINWEYKDYRPAGFELWEAQSDRYHKIGVIKLSDISSSYTVRWYYKDMTEIKEHIDAKGWDEAKAYAISNVKNDISQHAAYWRDMKIGFTNWVVEE